MTALYNCSLFILWFCLVVHVSFVHSDYKCNIILFNLIRNIHLNNIRGRVQFDISDTCTFVNMHPESVLVS